MISNNFYIHRFDIRDDEWHLLDALPKHKTWTRMPLFCNYISITADGSLLDSISTPLECNHIYNLPEFIEKFNEYRLFLLL